MLKKRCLGVTLQKAFWKDEAENGGISRVKPKVI
jgi:hypothetical protein